MQNNPIKNYLAIVLFALPVLGLFMGGVYWFPANPAHLFHIQFFQHSPTNFSGTIEPLIRVQKNRGRLNSSPGN